MHTFLSWQTRSSSSAATETLAATLAKNLKGGEVIELVSDLGGGKTTFVRGLVHGLGSTSHVSSPTFKICNEYQSPRFRIYHFDFYRLAEAGLIANELAESIDDASGISVIEWGDVIQDVLPSEHLRVDIKNQGEHERSITFHYPKSQAYLLKGLA
jgi:tRNA threonylcarbamoyladenosine biosynthesis protein TsaE